MELVIEEGIYSYIFTTTLWRELCSSIRKFFENKNLTIDTRHRIQPPMIEALLYNTPFSLNTHSNSFREDKKPLFTLRN